MTAFKPAADVVNSYVRPGKIDSIEGSAASGLPHLESARLTLESAHRELEHNPESAYILAYDAARKAGVAVLAQQGLRTRGSGHHATVAEILRVQCGGPFEQLDIMRRRRNEVEYPMIPGDGPDRAESAAAIDWAGAIIDAAQELLPTLARFDLIDG